MRRSTVQAAALWPFLRRWRYSLGAVDLFGFADRVAESRGEVGIGDRAGRWWY